MLKSFMLAFLFFSQASYVIGSELQPEQLLLNMQQAMKTLNFEGTVAFLRNDKLDTFRYFHATVDGKEQERMLALNTPIHEVIRDAGAVSCFSESSKQVLVDHRPATDSFLIDLPTQVEEIVEYYDLKIMGEEQVARLQSWVLDVTPKDSYRYGRRIWIDQQYFLPLKVQVYDVDNTVIEQFVFTDLQLQKKALLYDAKAAMAGREIRHIHERLPLTKEPVGFELTQIPAGFVQEFYMQLTLDNTSQTVEHLLLTDGFSSVSVYLDSKGGNMTLGAHNAEGVNSYVRELDNFFVIVMGEVPAENVRYIAEGIKLRASSL